MVGDLQERVKTSVPVDHFRMRPVSLYRLAITAAANFPSRLEWLFTPC
jgi:hypothetical protein